MTSKLLLAAILIAAPSLYAQDAPAPPAAAPAPVVRQRAQPAPRPAREGREDNMRDHDRDRDERGGGMRGGPGGTWWRNPEVAARVGLTAEQKKRIDDLFLQNRVQLIHLHASLEEAELMLEPLMDANPFDQSKATAQIGKIADTRAELEKTNARMLVSIRAVLNADQWTKLQDGQHGPQERGPGGPGGPMGPRGRGPGGQAPPAPPQ